jgi:hypothetical protein
LKWHPEAQKIAGTVRFVSIKGRPSVAYFEQQWPLFGNDILLVKITSISTIPTNKNYFLLFVLPTFQEYQSH